MPFWLRAQNFQLQVKEARVGKLHFDTPRVANVPTTPPWCKIGEIGSPTWSIAIWKMLRLLLRKLDTLCKKWRAFGKQVLVFLSLNDPMLGKSSEMGLFHFSSVHWPDPLWIGSRHCRILQPLPASQVAIPCSQFHITKLNPVVSPVEYSSLAMIGSSRKIPGLYCLGQFFALHGGQ